MVTNAQYAVLFTLLMASITSSTAANFSIAKRGCDDHCGEVQIPYPFGIGEGCSLNTYFNISCDNPIGKVTPVPDLLNEFSNVNVTYISLEGHLGILMFIFSRCYNEFGTVGGNGPSLDFSEYSYYTINTSSNMFFVIGCDDEGIFVGNNRTGGREYRIGCMTSCNALSDITDDGSCDGIGCCQSQIPWGMSKLNISLSSNSNHSTVLNESTCGYAFVANKKQFNFSSTNLTNLQNVTKLPMVLDWVVGTDNCTTAEKNLTGNYACKGNNTKCLEPPKNLGYRCACVPGFEGNPYLDEGCTDIDECKDEDHNNQCVPESVCVNNDGNYNCNCKDGYTGDGYKGDGKTGCQIIIKGGASDTSRYYKLISGICVGVVFILVLSFLLYTEKRKRKLQHLREKFFRDNGGMLLKQQLSTRESGHQTRIFSIDELKRAADNFDESRIIGKGGFGTVYKGYLEDNSVIAIKKSNSIDHNQVDSFINEVIVLSQINHRNVVKLLGCCLETELPFLVYEFVDNETLSDHIHDITKSSRLSFQTRLKIAAESAGVLSYLHSAASPPIIHRDVKSANILLDQNYTAKVADFGISKINMSDEAEISTMVQGTIGYLDPEYMHTSQLTEKSDVYSFGVLLIELFTGKSVLSFNRPEEERNLAKYFLLMLKNDSLGDIFDCRISNEATKELLDEIAILAKRCVSIIGEDRPTMKEVAIELEGMRLAKCMNFQLETNGEEVEPLISLEASSSYKFDGNSINTSCTTDGHTDLFPIKNVGGR